MCADRVRGHGPRCPNCHLYVRSDGRCTRCDHLRPLLPSMSVMVTRYCVHCGRRQFVVPSYSKRLTCSDRCNCARWRAITKLAGTHVSIGGRWIRIAERIDV
jgi:hypothetical protein